MTEWLGYSLTDLLPYSQEAWLRLLELYNARFWPMVLLGLAIGIASLLLLPTAGRRPLVLPGVILCWGLCWLWVAWGFQLQTYARLNWAGSYFALAFAVQGLLLLGSGVWASRWTPSPTSIRALSRAPKRALNSSRQRGEAADWADQASDSGWIGYGIVLFAVLVLPLVGLLQGHVWKGLALFGSTPDPTAIATLGLAVLLRGRLPLLLIALLLLIPASWCLISAATLAAMDDALWPLPLLSALLGVVAASRGASRASRR